MKNGCNGCELLIKNGCRTGKQWVEQRLSPVVQQYPLEMSTGHAGGNCAVVMGSNGIAVPVNKAVGYINPFLRKNGTVAIKNSAIFCQNGYRSRGNRWGLLINSSCNGSQRKLQWERVQRPFSFY